MWRGLESSFCNTDVHVALEIKRGTFPLVHCCRWQRDTCCDSVKEKLQNGVPAEDTWAFTKATVKLDNLSMYLLKHLQLPFQSRWHNKYWAWKSSSVSECLIKFLLFKLSKSDLDRLSFLFSADVRLWLEFLFLILLYFQLHHYKVLLPLRTESEIFAASGILQKAEITGPCVMTLLLCLASGACFTSLKAQLHSRGKVFENNTCSAKLFQ